MKTIIRQPHSFNLGIVLTTRVLDWRIASSPTRQSVIETI